MSEYADTIRVALRPGMTAGEALAALAALAALEAELAEARRDIDDVKRRASELCVQLVLTEERCEAAEAEDARLKAALEPFACLGIGLPMSWVPMEWWPFVDAARDVLSGNERTERIT